MYIQNEYTNTTKYACKVDEKTDVHALQNSIDLLDFEEIYAY